MKKILFFVSLVLIATSCISNKRITYLQNLPEATPIALEEFIPFAAVDYQYVLQPYDIVEIDFATSDPELIEAFSFQNSKNASGSPVRTGSNSDGSDPLYFTGYSIDQLGNVEVPKLGKIKIAGLTEEEAKDKVQVEINKFFKEEIYVKLRIAGIRYTTLGEFNNVGVSVIYKNRATIFDALANSGETTILGKKNQLFIIRQYDGGTKIHQVNLNDRALLASPFYFIQPNDILYMEPMTIRQFGNADNLTASLALVAGLLASTLLIISLLTGN